MPSTLLLAEWCGRMGQELFFPPNVGGWPGGRSWLSGRTVVARANFAAALTSGQLLPGAAAPKLDQLARKRFACINPAQAIESFSELLTGRRPTPGTDQGPQSGQLDRAIAGLLARPDAQLI
jgi:hypothetical protein